MPELADPYPGWTPPHLGLRYECMRQAVACAIGEHPIRLPYIDPFDNNVDWLLEWRRAAYDRGFHLQLASRTAAEDSGRYWIATVPSLTLPRPTTHAVVMKGAKLHFDSSPIKSRKRAPRVLKANPLIARPR